MEVCRKKSMADWAYVLLVVFPLVLLVWWLLIRAKGINLPTAILDFTSYPAVRIIGMISIVAGAVLAFGGKMSRALAFLGGYGLLALVASVALEIYMRRFDPGAPTSAGIGFIYVVGVIVWGYIASAIVLAAIWFARGKRRQAEPPAA